MHHLKKEIKNQKLKTKFRKFLLPPESAWFNAFSVSLCARILKIHL